MLSRAAGDREPCGYGHSSGGQRSDLSPPEEICAEGARSALLILSRFYCYFARL